MQRYRDRYHAGQILAELLEDYANRSDVIIFALPRGGVPVAYEIATRLHVPMDVFVVRKIGMPGYEEFAMGAIATGGTTILHEDAIRQFHVSDEDLKRVVDAEKKELDRRNKAYRKNRPFPDLKNKTIMLVDDGIATGATMQAAVDALKQHTPREIIIAVPVAARESCRLLETSATIVCPLIPQSFNAVGQWYETFPQTSDEEVFELLEKVNARDA